MFLYFLMKTNKITTNPPPPPNPNPPKKTQTKKTHKNKPNTVAFCAFYFFYPPLLNFDRVTPGDHSRTTRSTRTRKEMEGNVLFNYALNTFYLRLYGVRHMVKDHSDSERGNLLPPHRLLFSISSKGSFICIIPQTG